VIEAEFVIPYPPSGNHMWKHTKGGGHYLTTKVLDYYRLVHAEVHKQMPGVTLAGLGTGGRLGVRAILYPPDRRKRDMDNAWKVISDACTRAGVWVDDTLIDQLTLIRARESQAKGVVEMRVWEFPDSVAQSA
jgi:crossover junction endodeoxyribonuclease RusA